MSLYSEILDCPQVETSGEAFVLICIANHANNSTPRTAFPSEARLACMSRMSRSGLQKILRGLVRKGLLKIERRPGRGHGNTYTIGLLEKGLLSRPFSEKKGLLSRHEKAHSVGPELKNGTHSAQNLSDAEKTNTLRKVGIAPESPLYALLHG